MKYLVLLFQLIRSKNMKKKSPERIRKIQEKRLTKLLKYVYHNSAYYHNLFTKAGISEKNIGKSKLQSIPVTDKKTFFENFDAIVTQNDITQEEIREFDRREKTRESKFKNKYHIVHSSGSTGIPSFFLYDEKAWNSMLVGILRAALWDMGSVALMKHLIEKPRLVFIAATDGRYGGTMAVGDGVGGLGIDQIHLDIKMPMSKWIAELKRFKPNVIVGYPTAIKILCELIEKNELQLSPILVVSCGEFLGSGIRQYIEKIMGTSVINLYGASESLALGVESSQKNGMVLFDDMNVVEVMEDAIYITSLYNFAQPLIRYKLTDQLELMPAKEGDDCPFTRAEKFLGRNEDILWFTDSAGKKEFLHPLAIEGFCEEGLLDYQFVQDGISSFRMIAESSDETKKDKIRNKITKEMRIILSEKGLDYVAFSIEFTDNILADKKTGKKPLILKEKQR